MALPRIWTVLGHPVRAEALAESITAPAERLLLLIGLVAAAIDAEDPARLDALLAEIVALVEEHSATYVGEEATAELIGWLIAVEEYDRAEPLLELLGMDHVYTDAATTLLAALAEAGQWDRAEALADAWGDAARIWALATIAAASAEHGDPDRAADAMRRAHSAGRDAGVSDGSGGGVDRDRRVLGDPGSPDCTGGGRAGRAVGRRRDGSRRAGHGLDRDRRGSGQLG